jgi:hypothetical protein
MDTKKQIIIFIGLSLLVGFLSNIFNSNPIPWIAKPMDLMTESVDLESILSDPQIREIDLKMATSLHKSGLLFVDARAEEYFPAVQSIQVASDFASVVELHLPCIQNVHQLPSSLSFSLRPLMPLYRPISQFLHPESKLTPV